MGRSPCCDKTQVKRGPWSPQEDETLKTYLQKHGTGGNWITLPQKAGLKRCGKSCRLRWLNYLRPDIKHGAFTREEDNIICTLYSKMGSRWSIIASNLPGRTDNDVKNHWNTRLKKKLMALAVTSTATTTLNNVAANNTASQFYDPNFPAFLTQTTPATMPFLGDHEDHNIAFTEGSSKSGSISKFLHSGSQPQEDSSISEASSLAKNQNFAAAWPDNGGCSLIEGLPLMDVNTANSYQIVNTGILPPESTFVEANPSLHEANFFGLFYY